MQKAKKQRVIVLVPDSGFERALVKSFGERRDWFFGEIYMAEVKDHLEIKFRLNDGSDIGPKSFPDATTVAALKETVVSQWPRG